MVASSWTAGKPGVVGGRILRQMPFGLLLCLALLSNLFVTGGHDRQRLLGVAVLAAAALAAILMRQRPSLFAAQAAKPLAVFFLLGILGSVRAFSPGYALFEVVIFFLLYLFAQLIAAEIGGAGSAGLLVPVRAMAIVCAGCALQFWVAYGAGFALGIPLDFGDFALPFANIRFFNHMQTATLPLLILLCCVTPATSRLRWLWWPLTAYWWMAIFATSGRGTLLGMAAAGIAVAALRRRPGRAYLKAAALSMLGGLLMYFVFLVAIPVLAGGVPFGAFSDSVARTMADPASRREVLWQRAIELIVRHPWMGVGPMHFAHNAGDLHTGAHPHDWVLQIAAEWGIPALLCLCAALALAMRALLRAGSRLAVQDTLNQAICSALVAGSAAILADGLVSGLFVMPQSQLAIALFLGCAIGWCRAQAGAPQAAPVTGMRRAGGAILIAAAAVCLLAAVLPDAAARYTGQDYTAHQQALNGGTTWPRLWRLGYF